MVSIYTHNLTGHFKTFGVQNCKIKAFPANANNYSFCKIKKPKYELEKTSKFKFNKGTIDTHSTIANRQHRVFLTFLTFLLSVVLAFLTLSHNMCHFKQQSIAHSGYSVRLQH